MRVRVISTFLCLLAASAQTPPKEADWQTTVLLPEVDFSGLTAAQKKVALKQLRALPCLCSCSMRMAECRVKDPQCGDSRALARLVVKAVREGKDVQQEVNNSDLVARRAGSPNILEKPVTIPIQGAPAKGPGSARITLIEFSDFECPFCSKAAAKIDTILQAYPKDARLIYKHYLVQSHRHARLAAEASLAANAQDKFWPMHDKLFANSSQLSEEKITELAKAIGLDMARFQADLKSGKFRAAVNKDVADGDKVDIAGTPTLFVNGKRYNGPFELEVLKPLLDNELKAAK
jgi:protein-disulfide isomerase